MAPQKSLVQAATTAYRVNLEAFVTAMEIALESGELRDEESFKPILKLAIERLGMTPTSLSERVRHSKGAISKWLNTPAMPSQSTREIAMEWILDQAREQLKDFDETWGKAQRPLEKRSSFGSGQHQARPA